MENTPLSPEAQAVLDAATAPTGSFCLENVNEIAAAAIRAAVKACAFEDFNTRLLTAADLLTIADELEAL